MRRRSQKDVACYKIMKSGGVVQEGAQTMGKRVMSQPEPTVQQTNQKVSAGRCARLRMVPNAGVAVAATAEHAAAAVCRSNAMCSARAPLRCGGYSG